MRTCIWCQKNENDKTFKTRAHTIPESLGGKNICENVCDECNLYFGSKNQDGFSIEEVLKETFNITRQRMLDSPEIKYINNSKRKYRFKSKYFKISTKSDGSTKLKLKQSFRKNRTFQSKLSRYFKRGLYKVFLEESERQFGNALAPKFDFIREYARYNLGKYPVFYFERKLGIILMFNDEAESPEMIFDRMNYLYSGNGFTEIEFLGHVFGIPIQRMWEFDFDNYIKNSIKRKTQFFKEVKQINYLIDIDLTLSILND